MQTDSNSCIPEGYERFSAWVPARVLVEEGRTIFLDEDLTPVLKVLEAQKMNFIYVERDGIIGLLQVRQKCIAVPAKEYEEWKKKLTSV